MWNRLLLILALGCIAANVQAQKSGEILIVAKGGIDDSATRLINAIKPHYPGVITLRTELPDVLNYDAVMMIRKWSSDDFLDSLEQAKLIDYVRAGGRFYAEGVDFRNRETDQFVDNQLWDFIGDSTENIGMLMFDVDFVRGISGEFTADLDFRETPTIPVGTSFYLQGMIPILQTASGPSGFGAHIAWRSPSLTTKAVLHWPVGSKHYDAFIARVVCTYFQLCTLGLEAEPRSSNRLSFDPIMSELRLPQAGRVAITDILGRTVFEVDVDSDRMGMPPLSPGSYIATWSLKLERVSVTFAIH